MNGTYRIVGSIGIILVLLCAVPPRPISASDEWLPIPPADLALKDNPASPGANAMILYLQSDIDSKGSWVEEYVRTKIFTQEGTKEGDVEIPFGGKNTSIEGVRGRTIHPDGTVVNFQGKVFDKTIVKAGGYRQMAKSFTLPDVHPGSIIEYKYREQDDQDYYINESWIVTNRLFTRDERFTIKPDTREYALQMAYRQFNLPAGTVLPTLQPNGTFTMDIHNIAGLEEEEYMPPKRTLEGRVDFFYKNRNDPDKETPEHFWKRTAKTWSDEVDRFVNKKSALESDLAQTIDANDSPEAKLRKIYARVEKLRNLSIEDSKTVKEQKQEQLKPNANVEDVLKHGYGTARQLNYTFTGLARAAGFPTFEVFVAPRHVNLFNPALMDASELSADVVWVHAGTQDYYLDPAAAFYPFGMLPWFENTTQGVRCKKDGGEVEATPQAHAAEAAMMRTADVEIDSEGEATVKIQVDFTGQLGAYRRRQIHDEDEAGRQKTLEEEIKASLPAGSTFDITAIKNWNNNELPVHVEGTAKIPTLGTSAGRRMLIPAAVFQASEPAAFHPEKRLYPIYFNCPYQDIDDVKLHVPAGYKIEGVPPERKVKPGAVAYEISAAQQNNVVEVKRLLEIDGLLFPTASYKALRTFFNYVKTDDDAQIVLQNAESAKNN
jgi:hypothetical protein